jgi:hypothetical protein
MTQSIDYSSIRAVSNSLMGVYEDDYSSFVSYWVYKQPLPNKSTGSLTLGSLVDTLLTRPQDYDDKFSVFKGKAPTGQMNIFCREYAKTGDKQAAYEYVNFKLKRDTVEHVMTRFEEFKDFYDALISCKTCVVISKEDNDKAQSKFKEMKSNKYVSHVVNEMGNEFKEVFHQLELTQKYKSITIKGALDKVVVDHLEKIIYPFDYKTSFDALQFEESYRKYRYYRQGSFYMYLLEKWRDDNGWKDYKIANFAFVVCSTTSSKHFIYQMDVHDIELAETGGYLMDGTYVKGWREILNEIDYMTLQGDWTYPYKVVHNKGIVPLRIFK